ncbi:hypothetical protein GCM10007913_11640 [Devosia yakushimensis]|uniref:Terminase small subunit n=1 Tax=Devosia yakushimensis TaxID=470028 RepID=A0ABQ5UAT2_9HYPH|nr:terminase small subunit [Devosia yakushimensis]GLQ09232.1 hypothetical protein GCM10007913_11640 [Devosia yakushimensis]
MRKRTPAQTKEEIARAKARAIADKYFEADGEPIGLGDREHAPGLDGGATKKLTPKEFLFCQEYLVDFNGTQAAIRAGYSEKTAAAIAYENLRKPHIRRCITELMKERSARTKWDADKLLQRLGDELEADINDIHNPDGSMKPIADWPLVFRQGLVEGLKVREELTPDGEVVSARIVEYRTASRSKLKEMIGKHVDVQAFKEKRELDVAEGGPLAQLLTQLQGTSIRPTQAPPISLPVTNPDLIDDDEGDDE